MRRHWYSRAILIVGVLALTLASLGAGEDGEDATTEPQRPPERTDQPFAFANFFWGNGILAPFFLRAANDADVPIKRKFPSIPPDEAASRDRIVANWELASSRTVSLSAKFECWEYEPVFGPANTFKTHNTGYFRFKDPDKWEYRIEKTLQYSKRSPKDEEPKYVTLPESPNLNWVCDGKSLFEFDYAKKQIIERQFGPEDGAKVRSWHMLPFFMGLKAEVLRKRFHIRVITPGDERAADWLELSSTTNVDAAAFQKVQIILDRKDALPTAMQVFAPKYDAKRNPARYVYAFSDRRTNGDLKPEVIACEFPVVVPKGWSRIVERIPDKQPAATGATQNGD